MNFLKKSRYLFLLMLLLPLISGCTSNSNNSSSSSESSSSIKEKENMYIKLNNKSLKVDLEDNSSSQALVNLLIDGDISIDMHDYGNFEKTGDIGHNLPTNDSYINVDYGDIILYQGRSLCIYYDKNSWNFTRLGKINNVTKEEIKNFLTDGDITITISVND